MLTSKGRDGNGTERENEARKSGKWRVEGEWKGKQEEAVSVYRTDLVVLYRLLDSHAHRFSCFSSIFLCFSYSYMRLTKFANSLVNFWAHDKILLID